MQLGIRYTGNNGLPVQAACISGSDPAVWLREMSRWGVSPDDLDCYLFPESVHTDVAGGLFVLFRKNKHTAGLLLKEPYTRIGSKLYIPADASLWPAIDGYELDECLFWECQLFHPLAGFIGFEQKDRLDLMDLLQPGKAIAGNWHFAHPGIPACPPFGEIRLEQPVSDIINEVKNEIRAAPLNEIPLTKEEAPGFLSAVMDRLKMAVLWLLRRLLLLLMRIIPATPVSNEEEGVLNKLERWIADTISDLQKKREKELNRLLRLFEQDTDEALRYAIPLDSPDLHRGVAKPSDKLGRRNINFNPFGRPSAGPADFWDVGDYYNDLRKKYLDAATLEMKRKNYKKAAYIYAELLADFKTAASVLQKGGFYREAAAVYQSRLNNKAAAAECLKNGGLYLEAISIYKELLQVEEAGDLYARMQDEVNARDCWEQAVSRKLEQNDHLDAARVVTKKLNETDRAMEMLALGWRRSHQGEACLRAYMDLSLEKGPADTRQRLQDLYGLCKERQKRVSLFNVLDYIRSRHTDEQLSDATRELAYTLVHEEAEHGNLHLLPQLKNFISADRLFASDASRYLTTHHGRLINERIAQTIYLDNTIKWIQAICHGFQFLVLGIFENKLQLARGNWYGNLEYYKWPHPVKSHFRYSFIFSAFESDQVLLIAGDEYPVTRRNLPKNKYFTRPLVVYCPVWLHKCKDQLAVTGENRLTRITTSGGVTISESDFDGSNATTITCQLEDGSAPGLTLNADALIRHGDQFYSWGNKTLYTIHKEGHTTGYNFDTGIRFVKSSGYYPVFYLLISTNMGCLLYAPISMEDPEDRPFFAESLIPHDAVFVDADHFVLLEKKRIHLFRIEAHDSPWLVHTMDFSANVISVMPTNEQKQYAVIEENGRVSRHNY